MAPVRRTFRNTPARDGSVGGNLAYLVIVHTFTRRSRPDEGTMEPASGRLFLLDPALPPITREVSDDLPTSNTSRPTSLRRCPFRRIHCIRTTNRNGPGPFGLTTSAGRNPSRWTTPFSSGNPFMKFLDQPSW